MNLLKNRNVLVTGGCGFIGSALVRLLVSKGANVTAVDNLVTGKKENLNLDAKNLHLEISDIRDVSTMRKLIQNSEIVYHLACLGVRHSIHSPKENNEVNSTATLDLLTISKEENINRFVHVSTSEVYGTAVKVPMDEETPAFPHTIYGSSKLAGECHARAFAKTYNFPSVIVRPFNSYGPFCHHEGDSGEVIPKFMLRALADRPMLIFGDGRQTRDFTYVDDTAYGIYLSGISDSAIGHTINIGSGNEISINELASLIANITKNTKAKIKHIANRPGDILRLFSDSNTAKKILGFEPRINLKDGLNKLLLWYMDSEIPPEQLLESESELNWLT